MSLRAAVSASALLAALPALALPMLSAVLGPSDSPTGIVASATPGRTDSVHASTTSGASHPVLPLMPAQPTAHRDMRSAPAGTDAALAFRPPVEASVSDPFRIPEGPYGPGNRGLEYATGVGDAVRAAADGEVSFAGQVAGELHVTLDHGDGVRSSYSYLGLISVAHGAKVARGGVVGLTGERLLHFSVRIDGEYVDPAALMGVRRLVVRLIPVDRDRRR